MPYIAHVSEDGSRREGVAAHLHEVAEMAERFARPFNAGQLAYTAGLSHDIGKYSLEFQNRILRGGYKVDHSTAGAIELAKAGGPASLLAYCAAGHHGGLPDGGTRFDDGGTLLGRLSDHRAVPLPDYRAFASEIELPACGEFPFTLADMRNEDAAFSLSFFIRMVFSCLVDADFLCTERFMRGDERPSTEPDPLPILRDRLEDAIRPFYPPQSALNETRCSVLDACRDAARLAPGVFSLTVPTGGGKTLAAMRFALNHACYGEHPMKRVICAVPYTSIIEQNAAVYREKLGAHNVLEHHASFDFDDQGEMDTALRLAAENWDMPVVVTTNVQLFESLYANKTSRTRKLHNIANSVIVLDEAQMIPTGQLLPCIRALVELVKRYGCTIVLCTATQPSLDRFFERHGLQVREIVPDVPALFDRLRRTSYRMVGSIDNGELARRLGGHRQVLCIVNSRQQARELFGLVQNTGTRSPQDVFHLTTLMHSVHRSRTLALIRERVAQGLPCVVIATSLVEAGVDLDFPVVYRALAGLDSIVQAAGRCNREGRHTAAESVVYVFEPPAVYAGPRDTQQRASVARSVLPALDDPGASTDLDLGSTEAVSAFFERLYEVKGDKNLDKSGVLKLLETPRRGISPIGGARIPIACFSFAQAANAFRLIEDGSHPVIIPDEDIDAELERLSLGIATIGDMRSVSRRTVGVYDADVKSLLAAGAIQAVAGDTYLLTEPERYRPDTGLDMHAEQGAGIFL